jgi:PAS domain S-box-containing protein
MKLPLSTLPRAIALVLCMCGNSLAAFTPPKQVVVVSDDTYPPYLFRTETGLLQGIIVDKWALWSKKTGIPVIVEGMAWIGAQELVSEGSADVIEALAFTEARTQAYEFSAPYADVDARVFFHQSISAINQDPASMRGFTIGAKYGSACANWLSERGIDMILGFPTSEGLIKAASGGEVRLFCMDSPVARYFLFKLGLADEFRQTDPLYETRFHWAVAKGRTELRDFIQSGFGNLTTEELREIDDRWLGHPVSLPINTKYLYGFGAGLIAAATLLIAWNRALRARVSARTAELRTALDSAHAQMLALKESEARFGQVFRLSPDGIMVTSVAEGRVIEANEAFCQIVARPREEVIGRTTLELGFWRDSHERRAMVVVPAMTPGGIRQYEHVIRTPGGEQRNVLARATRIDLQGAAVLLSMVEDVTERRRAEHLLEESERRLAKMIEASPEAITIASVEDGIFILVNPAGERLSGYTRDEMIGRSALAMGFYPDPEERRRLIADLQRNEIVHGRELRLRRKDGVVRDVLASAALIDTGGQKVVLFQGIDITERKNSEKALREHQELLRELSAHHDSVREEERARIAREIHDEMGQSLTALKMDLSVIGLESGKKAPRIAGQVQELKGRVDGLIQTVRDVATALRPAALDLGILPAIEWLVDEFQKRNGIPCQVKVEDGDVDLAEDRSIVLFRILQESLTNISRHAKARNVEISLRRDATHVRLDVKDDGQGFDADAAGKKKTFGLLGMRERVIMLHGNLSISSVPGEGTQVSVSIPCQ